MSYGVVVLIGQTMPANLRAILALVLLFVMLTGGLIIVNLAKRVVSRHADDPRRPKPYQPPPGDDWARKPMVSAEPPSDEVEVGDQE